MATKKHRNQKSRFDFLCFLWLFCGQISIRMRIPTVIFLLVLAVPCAAQGVVDGFIARTYRNESRQSMPYRLFVPPSYDKEKQYPLVLWLHGAGGAGSDNLAQISEDQILGTHTWTRPQNQSRYPTFVLVP